MTELPPSRRDQLQSEQISPDPQVVAYTIETWAIHFPETGETRECKSLRRLVWDHYEPRWLWRLRQPFMNWFSCPLSCKFGKHKLLGHSDGTVECLRCWKDF